MDFALPEIGEGVYEAELVSWLVKPGDAVKRGQGLAEVMTDKATMEIPSPFAGTVGELRARPGQTVKVGDVLLSYAPAERPAGATTSPVANNAGAGPDLDSGATHFATAPPALARAAQARGVNGPVRPQAGGRLPLKAAPSVRQLARKLGIELTAVRGTGPDGRILVEDLTLHVAAPTKRTPPEAEPGPDYGRPGTRIKLQGLRRRIAEHLTQARRSVPDYSYVDECDVSELVRLRESLRDVYARAGIKLTYLAFFVKAAVAALKEIAIVNSSLDEEAGEIVLHDRYHIGIAVATAGGLIVPVLRDADRMDLGAIAREIERLSNQARTGRVRLEDLRGGTFTVTSVGNIGGLFSTPILNHPEAAILGVGKIVKLPVFDDAGQVRPADLIYLSLTFDHRVIDGAVGAAFGNSVIRQLRNPAALLLPPQL
jgi:pyruvate dehydrogenase E2 component (dihydrolipoamide acetyltransferase)/2-oxoisovalerate dehydrogenase E2 component (dihydrolipoyl transacylase)